MRYKSVRGRNIQWLLVALLGSFLIGFGVTACGSSDDSGDSDTPIKIAYLQPGSFDYYKFGADGAVEAAKQLGVDIKVYNANDKPETEIANAEDAIQQGVDGVVYFPVVLSSEKAVLNRLKQEGIPVAVVGAYDESVDALANVFVYVDNHYMGSQIGEWTADNVDSGEVAVIQGALGRGDAEATNDGFKEGLSQNPGLKVVAEPAADWDRSKAVSAMEDVLTKYPDLKAVFVMNEDMALGAAQAIKSAGKSDSVKLVSANGSEDGIKAVKDGTIAATVGWSPSDEGAMGLVRIVDLIRDGTEPDPHVCVESVVVITKENLSDARSWPATPATIKKALTAECSN